MARPPASPLATPSRAAPKSALAALVGLLAAAGLMFSIPQDESSGRQHLRAYRDIVGVWTICDGDTKGVTRDTVETPEGCARRLEAQLVAHARPVMSCTPRLAEDGRDNQRWAAVSLAFNVGTNAYCASSVDAAFDAGDWRGGCDAILRFNRGTFARRPAGLECRQLRNRRWSCVIPGLAARRGRERAICLRGLAA